MSDQNSAPGFEPALGGFSAATKSMQTFSSEIARMSKESVEHTTQLVEKLRNAKTIEDIVSIQTNFMQQSFSNYADYTRRFGELLTMLPLELAKHSRTAVQQGTEAVARNVEQTGQHVQQASDQFQHNTQSFNNDQGYNNDQNYNNNQNYGHSNNY
ncbi:phasin family protein [Beijerinckia sp. L45]|uniref:phasin family protein n=1 Tax=Beijerinckia sp. L45 TaxID=1641855 RepID=UPI00131BCC1D|nr:phasin family protein [Beijerinckia sp. L45]